MKMRLVRVDGGFRFADAASERAARALPAGAPVVASVAKPINNKFHRKFFALLRFAFDYWEPAPEALRYRGQLVEKNFTRFRHDVTILCGHYEPTYNARGEVRLVARSLAFGAMEPEEFEALYSTAIDVLMRMVMAAEGFSPAQLRSAVDEIVAFDG